jgi:hypothetical protein
MTWNKSEDKLPSITVATDWGKSSIPILGDYGKDQEWRYLQLSYEEGEADGEDWVEWFNPDGEVFEAPERWCYIEE